MRRGLTGFFLIALVPLLVGAQGSKHPALAITNVSIVDTEIGAVDAGMTVVISGNRIRAVGKNVAVPSGARVVAASGKFLIPGLWDMHSHSLDRWEWSSLLNVANGVTGFRDPAAVMPVEQIVKLRAEIESGKVFGPRFVASGRIIDGVPASRTTYVPITTVEEMKAEVAKRKNEKLDFVKIYTRLGRDAFFAAATEAKRLEIPLDGHVPLAVTAAEASDAGIRSVEHSYRHRMACATAETEIRELLLVSARLRADDPRAYWGGEDKAFLLGLNSYDSDKCVDLGRRFAKNGTWFVPTLVEAQTRFSNVFPDDSLFKDFRLKYVAPGRITRWRDDMLRDAGFLEGQMTYGQRDDVVMFDEREREMKNRLKMPFDLHRGGAGILAGTDVDNAFPFLFFGFSLHDELALLVKSGLSPLDALRAATLNPAKFLERESDLGTIRPGKLADMVLLNADPLKSIENTKKIDAVVLNGKYLSNLELRKLLTNAEAVVNRK